MITTTLNKIRKHDPCERGWKKLLKHLGKTKADNKPLPLVTILKSNGLDDALWCLRAVDRHDREMRLYAVDCARRVQHLMKDRRSINALDVAERYAYGQATDRELKAGYEAAQAAWAAARAAARAARAALDAAWSSTFESACLAAESSAESARAAAAEAAWVAEGADPCADACAAAWAAAGQAERKWQIKEFKRRFG